MSTKHHITNLPLEIRGQIFGEYFKVQGGYIYDSKADKLRNADNTPIDLSLVYTCRSIAHDCRHLPLAVNALHFSTLYREDWRSLAGCFNLAATYYNVLQQDLVLHLAHLITPEMHAQLEKRFPTFRSKLETERKAHIRAWNTHDDVRPVEDTDTTNTSEPVRPAVCEFIREFYKDAVSAAEKMSPGEYRGYWDIDEQLRHHDSPRYRTPVDWDMCDNCYQNWTVHSGEIYQCLPHCLRLIADRNPQEFAAHLYVCLPHWDGKYPAEDFFHLRFEHWAIPSRSQVAHVLDLLGVPDFVWKLPDIWSYDSRFTHDVGDNPSPGHFPREYNHPTVKFDSRIREKTRFSAASAAIRFLDSLTYNQRIQLRTITIHEDLPSVNNASLHGLGLVPFLQENPLLRVQRRVSVLYCFLGIAYMDLISVDRINVRLKTDSFWNVSDWPMLGTLSRWFLDARNVANAGISPGSFTLVLESGTDADFCTEVFERFVHPKIALKQAWDVFMESGLNPTERTPERLSLEREMTMITRDLAVGEIIQEAIMQLVNQTSTTLRCDFNPGLPKNHLIILEEMRADPEGLWAYWERMIDMRDLPLPEHLRVRETLAQCFDIQTGDEYFQSQARDHQ
ncbi:Ff.00g133310.m01.CDS01 [Fusarium sp. VM40]|nr:Ff.00g133310.m01.CDS01 [Fusarium sp. VM40]